MNPIKWTPETDMTKPGIYLDVPFGVYRDIDAVSASTLSHIGQPPKADTSFMLVGRCVHCAVLEPDKFPLTTVIYDRGRRGTNDFKAFAEQHRGKDILKPKEYQYVLDVRNAVYGNERVRKILSDPHGLPEATVIWTHERTGLLCKIRIDWLTPMLQFNLKTTHFMGTFDDDAVRFFYAESAAFYHDGALAAIGTGRHPFWIVVQTQAPQHGGARPVEVRQVSNQQIVSGREQYEKWLDQYVEYKRTGVVPEPTVRKPSTNSVLTMGGKPINLRRQRQ